ncbi:hypothetical protein TRVL_04146 [Trypanosoma vivax]|nr:hypothetical protein TRVL_04146 [Trypanosoma vivax]
MRSRLMCFQIFCASASSVFSQAMSPLLPIAVSRSLRLPSVPSQLSASLAAFGNIHVASRARISLAFPLPSTPPDAQVVTSPLAGRFSFPVAKVSSGTPPLLRAISSSRKARTSQ